MAKFVFALLCLALIHTGLALKCYTCTNPQDCENSASLKEETCGKSVVANTKAICVKKVYEDTKTKAKNIQRICGTVSSATTNFNKETILAPSCNAPADVTDPNRYKVTECTGCETDLCNAAPAIKSLTALIAIPFLFFITRVALY